MNGGDPSDSQEVQNTLDTRHTGNTWNTGGPRSRLFDAVDLAKVYKQAHRRLEVLVGNDTDSANHALSAPYLIARLMGHLSPKTTYYSYLHGMDFCLTSQLNASVLGRHWTDEEVGCLLGQYSKSGYRKVLTQMRYGRALDTQNEKLGAVLELQRRGYGFFRKFLR